MDLASGPMVKSWFLPVQHFCAICSGKKFSEDRSRVLSTKCCSDSLSCHAMPATSAWQWANQQARTLHARAAARSGLYDCAACAGGGACPPDRPPAAAPGLPASLTELQSSWGRDAGRTRALNTAHSLPVSCWWCGVPISPLARVGPQSRHCLLPPPACLDGPVRLRVDLPAAGALPGTAGAGLEGYRRVKRQKLRRSGSGPWPWSRATAAERRCVWYPAGPPVTRARRSDRDSLRAGAPYEPPGTGRGPGGAQPVSLPRPRCALRMPGCVDTNLAISRPA